MDSYPCKVCGKPVQKNDQDATIDAILGVGIIACHDACLPTHLRPAPMVLADCGHYTQNMMNGNTGTCCPDCYDRMNGDY